MRVEENKLKRIKEVQLSMLEELDIFCRENDIQYCLAYGTLLGAIRHNGYIPWDDDLDIWIPREDYNKLINSFKSENNKICTMTNTKKYPFRFPKLVNLNTRLVEEEYQHIDFKYGVYIDIFVLDIIPDNTFVQEIKYAKDYLNYAKLRFKYMNTRSKLFKKLQHKINIEKLQKKRLAIWDKSQGTHVKDEGSLHFFHKYKKNRRYIFDKNLFNEYEDHQFENLMCKIPKKYDEILKLCYGDYMELPPENEREVHNYVEFEEL